jgi:hypothetical protein
MRVNFLPPTMFMFMLVMVMSNVFCDQAHKMSLSGFFRAPAQGCQMVYIQTKNPNLGKFL